MSDRFGPGTGLPRRGVLALLASLGAIPVTGCAGVDVGSLLKDPGSAVEKGLLPPLVDVWIEVLEDGDAEFAFRFDGDVQSGLEKLSEEEPRVISSLRRKGLDVSRVPVEIDGLEEVPESRLVEGRIEGFALVEEWPVGAWYRTPRVT